MTCTSPPELADRELLTFIDDQANHRVATHLEHCSHCLEKAHRLARLQNRLTAIMYRLSCPTSIELGKYYLGLLPPTSAIALTQHLSKCPHCTRETVQLESFMADLAPELALRSLDRLMGQFQERVRVRVARPVLGGMTPAFAGVRGDQEGPFVYQADEVQVIVEVQDDSEQPGRKFLVGLVTGMDALDLKARLWRVDQPIATASVDDLGNFVMLNLIPDTYVLTLSSPDVEIHIPALKV
jgi:hypothetical protein